jgi:ABC-type nitrate/sulfonate/bicarbonate transport system ATPase subunit
VRANLTGAEYTLAVPACLYEAGLRTFQDIGDEWFAPQERVRKRILFVSHDSDEALKLGDKVSILEGGAIVQIRRAPRKSAHRAQGRLRTTA